MPCSISFATLDLRSIDATVSDRWWRSKPEADGPRMPVSVATSSMAAWIRNTIAYHWRHKSLFCSWKSRWESWAQSFSPTLSNRQWKAVYWAVLRMRTPFRGHGSAWFHSHCLWHWLWRRLWPPGCQNPPGLDSICQAASKSYCVDLAGHSLHLLGRVPEGTTVALRPWGTIVKIFGGLPIYVHMIAQKLAWAMSCCSPQSFTLTLLAICLFPGSWKTPIHPGSGSRRKLWHWKPLGHVSMKHISVVLGRLGERLQDCWNGVSLRSKHVHWPANHWEVAANTPASAMLHCPAGTRKVAGEHMWHNLTLVCFVLRSPTNYRVH